MRMWRPILVTLGIELFLHSALAATQAPTRVPPHGVIGVDEEMLAAEFWIARLANPDRLMLDRAAIELENATLLRKDASVHDLRAVVATLTRQRVVGWIAALSQRPASPLYGVDGKRLSAATINALMASRNLGHVAARPTAHYALVVHRADLRTFPTTLRVFDERGDTDIDRWQESALFPGTPVLSVHSSRDGRWRFVISPHYAAWIEERYLAEGTPVQVFDYAERTPYRIVTGAIATTAFTPEQPALSQLRLDMGVRIPLLNDWAADRPVNGQHPYTAHVIQLPLRTKRGGLAFSPALLPRSADTQADYPPLTRANILRQAFKFLGERYGWGHAYEARDCSGFVSDVYASLGVQMPRNTDDQSASPALHHRDFGATDDRAARMAAVRALEVGDLVYIPGHVMMAIGAIDGEPYVIHDTTGLGYRQDDGAIRSVHLNAVSVSPLTPLLFNGTDTYVDHITSIVQIRADTLEDASARP